MQLKKLEDLLSEANSRNEDLQKALTEVTVAKNRLTGRRDSVRKTHTFGKKLDYNKRLARMYVLQRLFLPITFYPVKCTYK